MMAPDTPKSGPLGRGPDPLPGPLFFEGTEKGTGEGTGQAESLAAMGGYGHTQRGTELGTEPLSGPLVPPPSIRGGTGGTEGPDRAGDYGEKAGDPDWTPDDTARLVRRILATFGGEVEAAPEAVREALARQAADATIPDQLTLGGIAA